MINFTDDAKQHIVRMVSDADWNLTGLRIEVVAGGCTGYEYKFNLIPTSGISPDDWTRELQQNQEVMVVVDPESLVLLVGSTVDFECDIMSSSFVITNPNAAGNCGCGKSFNV